MNTEAHSQPSRPQNFLGPLIRKLREKEGWTTAELAARFNDTGFECSEERLIRIEEQEEKIKDYEALLFQWLFPNSKVEISKFYSEENVEKYIQTVRSFCRKGK